MFQFLVSVWFIRVVSLFRVCKEEREARRHELRDASSALRDHMNAQLMADSKRFSEQNCVRVDCGLYFTVMHCVSVIHLRNFRSLIAFILPRQCTGTAGLPSPLFSLRLVLPSPLFSLRLVLPSPLFSSG